MPSGHHFSKEQNELMVYHCIMKESTAQFAFENIFVPGDVELDTVKQLWEKIKKEYETEENCKNFIEGGGSQGRKRSIVEDSDEKHMIEELLNMNRCVKMRVLTKQFHEECFPTFHDHLPSISSVCRAVKDNNSRKLVDWTSHYKNPIEQLEYLKEVASISSENMIDIVYL